MEDMTTYPKVDFVFLLSLALKENLAWNSLSSIVDNMTLNQAQSKNMIKVLLKELQQLQAKLQAKQDTFVDFSEHFYIMLIISSWLSLSLCHQHGYP